MSGTVTRLGPDIRHLTDGWTLYLTTAGEWENPEGIPVGHSAIPATVPGTVADALERAGQFDRTKPLDLDQTDAWYFCKLKEPAGAATLQFEGLATLADIFLNNQLILSTDSMFLRYDVDVELTGSDQLAICFRGLGPRLSKKQPRARWRPQMIVPASIRAVRTSLLGRMPGWCPEIHGVGPYRPITLLLKAHSRWHDHQIVSFLDEDGTGHASVTLRSTHSLRGHVISCSGVSSSLQETEAGVWTASLSLPDIEKWWPRTHGTPVLHSIFVAAPGEDPVQIGRTGFRRVEIDRGTDGQDFSIRINGIPVFCRGAVWTNADIVRLPGARLDYEPFLKLAAEAGFNMIRIGGTMTYETAEFFALCDELGLMVWQDAMLANFDYPVAESAFLEQVQAEIRQLLTKTAASPSFVVFCGGSEMYQQAAMLGLPESMWAGPLTEQVLPTLIANERPDIGYVPNSPSGGAMPFSSDAGVTHYYGVGAYCRPLDDARRANVRFSAESLAFANIPEQETLDHYLPVQPVHDPRWKARVPRDRGASWDFEDVRDHYLTLLYGFDASKLRREDPALYMQLSRAVTGEVLEATYAEWRRVGSSCHGALVFTLQDLLPGAGWGVIDSTGLPKSVWHAMRRGFRPLQVVLTDEGTNGLDVHVLNEKPEANNVTLELMCLRDGRVPVVQAQKAISLSGHSEIKFAATELFGAFFDTTYAFRFGPPSHSVTVATLKDSDGRDMASAFHFPQGRSAAIGNPHLQCELNQDDSGYFLTIQSDQCAQSVNITCQGFLASDNWFHLAPNCAKIVRLKSIDNQSVKPIGEVHWLGNKASIRF